MNKANILTSADFLSTIQVESTNSYTAINHKDVISRTKELLNKADIKIIQEVYHHCNDGQIAQGRYLLNVQNNEHGLELSWQNSVNKQVSFKYAVGNFTFVCTNSCVFGDLGSYKTRHVGSADVNAFDTMEEFIKRLEDEFYRQTQIYTRMKDVEMTKKTCAELVGRLFIDEEIITSTQVGIINREIKNPSFDYNVEDTLYNLFQHCTHSFKEVTPRTWLPKQIELSKFFIDEFQLV